MNLHYSAAVSLSEEDFEKIRESLAATVERAAGVIKDSPPHKVAIVNLDWFILA